MVSSPGGLSARDGREGAVEPEVAGDEVLNRVIRNRLKGLGSRDFWG